MPLLALFQLMKVYGAYGTILFKHEGRMQDFGWGILYQAEVDFSELSTNRYTLTNGGSRIRIRGS